mmetsp:Transcript_2394/g.6478  ORF Transcript_2394/g.6478 Transcript_2394/m.6478 type:complete len:323 (-) Transcript_2394:49-1017(-)
MIDPRFRTQKAAPASTLSTAAQLALALLLGIATGIAVQMLLLHNNTSACDKSLRESGGLFCMRDDEWGARVEAVRRSAERECALHRQCCTSDLRRREFECFEPVWSCLEERVGAVGDGGKWLCEVDRIRALARETRRACLIYSFGSNGDYSFEQHAHERMPECEIFTFDPTVNLRKYPPPSFLKFLPWGISTVDNVSARAELGRLAKPGAQMFRLQTMMQLLGHAGREVSVMKIDVEGAEYRVFEDLSREDFFPFRQIQLETHRPHNNVLLHEQLRRAGYAVFHKEPNYLGPTKYQEWAFVKLSPSIFADVAATPQTTSHNS